MWWRAPHCLFVPTRTLSLLVSFTTPLCILHSYAFLLQSELQSESHYHVLAVFGREKEHFPAKKVHFSVGNCVFLMECFNIEIVKD